MKKSYKTPFTIVIELQSQELMNANSPMTFSLEDVTEKDDVVLDAKERGGDFESLDDLF